MSVIKYRPDIDGLRAVAVGCVVCFHAFPNLLKGGFVGVDVFFVISGYLISTIIFQGLERGQFSYADFYARRIKRIFPALAAVGAATLFAGWYILLPDEFQALGKHVAGGAGFISNLILWNESGYFDAAAELKPLLHLWSLGIEEQFYLAWPLALGLIWRRKRGFLLVTLLVGAVSFGINVATVYGSPVAAFYSPLSRFWELMIGGVLAYIAMHRGELTRYSQTRSVAGLLLIAFAAVELNTESLFPGYWALLPTCGAFLMISAGPDAWLNKHVLANRLMVWVGLISYPLYLWHWPLLVLYRIASGRLLTPADRIGVVILAVVLSFLTYKFLEWPLRRSRGGFVPQMLAVVMAAIGGLGLLGYAGIVQSRLHTEGITKILAATYDWKYPPVAAQSRGISALRYFVEDSSLKTYTVFLGDSNMEQYAPRIDRAIKDSPNALNGAIFVGNQSGCPLLAEIIRGDNNCPAAVGRLKEVLAEPSTRAVAIVAAWYPLRDTLLQPDHQKRFTEFLKSLAAGKKVYLVLNMPTGDELAPKNMFDGSRLSDVVPRPAIRFDFARFAAKFRDINQALAQVAAASGAVLIDPIAQLCPQSECPVFDRAGNPLYRDEAHFTRSYAIDAATYIDRVLRP